MVYEVRAENLTFMAGSIAYHAFVSLLPLLLLALAVIAAVGSRDLQESFIAFVGAALSPGGGETLVSELLAASDSAGASALGLVILVWGTLRIFRGLDTAFSDIYESETENTFADQMRDGVLVLATVGVAVGAGVVVESRVALGGGPVGWVASRTLLAVGLGVALFPMYYVFPDQPDHHPLEAVPGVAVAALGLTAFESLFRLYLEFGSRSPEGNVVAGILVFLTWLYFSGLVVLLGAAVNAVTSNRSRDVNVRPLFPSVSPALSTTGPSVDEVLAALAALERRLPAAEEVAVVVDGERTSLPRPDRVRTRTDRARSAPGGLVGIELLWSPGDGEE